MKTLADLKRDLSVGASLTLISRYGKKEGKNIGVKRYVVKKNTVGVCLNTDKDAKRGSYLYWPKASLLEYDGETVKIFQSGLRPLTDEEKQILANQPKDEEQSRKEYLFSCKTQAGKRLKAGTRQTADEGSFSDWFIDDDAHKGEIGLVYKIA